MSQTKQTTDEVLDSLTGHEETWIADQFGRPIGELIPQPGMYRRALIFVLKRREGVVDDDARNAAMDMQMKDVLDYFPSEASSDSEAADAVEESGKDEPPDESQPESLLTSVI
jgi:hypothetical protein